MKIEHSDLSMLFSNTQIPDIFFTEYLSEASGDFIKIYLYILFLSKYDKDIKMNELCKKLNLPLNIIQDAMKYWEDQGVLTKKNTGFVFNHLQELGLRSVQMINLFSKICKGKMSSRNLELDIENLKYIEAIMKEKDFKDKVFIVAWGSSMASSRACNEAKRQIVTMFKKYCKNGTIYQLRSSKLDVARYPAVHVLYLGIRHKTEKWSLIPFDTSEIDGQIKENKLRIVKGDDDK